MNFHSNGSTFSEVSMTEESMLEACGICLNNFEEDEALKSLACSHNFHVHCIKQWFYKKRECPMCRANYESMVGIAQPPMNDEARDILQTRMRLRELYGAMESVRREVNMLRQQTEAQQN